MGVTDPPSPACATDSSRSIWMLMEAGSRTIAMFSVTATQQPELNAHPHGLLCGLWVLSLGAGAPSKSGAGFTERQQHGKRRGERHGEKVPRGEWHSKRRAAAARQAPIGSRTASAKRERHGKRQRSSTASEGAVRQAPSGRSTASAERGQHGERRTRAAWQTSRGSGITSAEQTGTKQMLNYRPRQRWALHRPAQSMGGREGGRKGGREREKREKRESACIV